MMRWKFASVYIAKFSLETCSELKCRLTFRRHNVRISVFKKSHSTLIFSTVTRI